MVSVIIPSYNREKKVKEAVESVLNQTWTDLEVIVVDDGSNDNTKEILTAIDDTRVIYIYQQNAGACVARNHGINLAKGEYIAFHDSDDIWHHSKLEKQMKVLLENDADIVFCKLIKYLSDGSIEYKPNYIYEGFLNPITNLFGIGTQTIVAKRAIFDEFRFNKSFPRFQEFEFLYRATQRYSIYCLDEGLVDYYVGTDSISVNTEKMYIACELLLNIHPELVHKFPVMGRRMAQYLLSAAIQVKKSKKGDARKYVKLSQKCFKDIKLILKSLSILSGTYSLYKRR
jgi:glycosyltransferase involved in cell wall biosynthesis